MKFNPKTHHVSAAVNIGDEYIDAAGKAMAEEIDKEIMEQLGWQLVLEGNPNWKLVQLPYIKRNDDGYLWNEVCAWAMEQFGLPGENYITHLQSDSINFLFRRPEDATLMILRWV